MKVTKAFRLLNRVGQVISSGQELAVFDVGNVWSFDGGRIERGRVKDTRIKVERLTGDLVWSICK